jgi:porphobilinogen synthase
MDRLKKFRASRNLRALFRENSVSTDDLIYPLFVTAAEEGVSPVASMPGVNRYSVDCLSEIIQAVVKAGIKAVIVFGIPAEKDEIGSGVSGDKCVVVQAIREIKRIAPSLVVMADVCLCEYTSHGHCGILQGEKIDDCATLEVISKAAVDYAKAGAEMVAPSGMTDGAVGSIRKALDDAGFIHTAIVGYSAKFASAYYGPFRDAAFSSPGKGDRKSYQMDPANFREALREVDADIKEGADAIIVKPALAYGDILHAVAKKTNLPIVAYSVSGEYSMVKAASANGWIDEKRIVLENLMCLKRGGADLIITYHALDAAKWITAERDANV